MAWLVDRYTVSYGLLTNGIPQIDSADNRGKLTLSAMSKLGTSSN